MPAAYPLPDNISPTVVSNTTSFLRIIALGLISGAAIASRLFAVVNFESIIHELSVLHSLAFSLSHLASFFPAIHGSTSASLRVQMELTLTCHSRATRVLASQGFYVRPFSSFSQSPSLSSIGILELVRPHRMVPPRSRRRWYHLPRSHGHQWCHLQYSPCFEPSRRHS